MTPFQTLVVLVIATIFGFIGHAIGRRKGHPVWGFFLGFVLSLIGILIISCTTKTEEAQIRKATERIRAEQEARRRLDAERS